MSQLGSADQHPAQVSCHITRTNSETHAIIQQNLDRSAKYSGAIEGVGPRYCPSIEDKVVRFADKTAHQIFIEPEGLNTTELYPNGISTSLPFDAQMDFVRTIEGFENAHISRPGYAIEYDFFDPRDLKYSLETRAIDGLYFAGQINGTTGYEEAGAQGLLAGINAARQAQGEAPWEPRRDEAYIGVLVDDLINFGTSEPYRMFTSRAEFRLRLRQDNADQRLTPVGIRFGVVGGQRAKYFHDKMAGLERLHAQIAGTRVAPGSNLAGALGVELSQHADLPVVLRRPEVSLDGLTSGFPQEATQLLEQVLIETKYAGYISRQNDEIAKIRRHEGMRLPDDLNYAGIDGLSNELRQKLEQSQPTTLARAARIPGMTPAALSILLVHAKKAGGN